MAPLFPALFDKLHFPMLWAQGSAPIDALMACDDLSFVAPENLSAAYAVIRESAMDWHLYGSTQWLSESTWVEFPASIGRDPTQCGILVIYQRIPAESSDPFVWIANENPLAQLFPSERTSMAIETRLRLLRSQAGSAEDIAGPLDSNPVFLQGYCIYRADEGEEARLVATYLDLLNTEGIPIPRYRMASNTDSLEYCRFALHALFRLNQARLRGMKFLVTEQLKRFEPLAACAEPKAARWVEFHPSRILRARPKVRALPNPTEMLDGIIHQRDFENVVTVRRRELNAHLLAFSRRVRPREHGMALVQQDANATLGAFVHRANGGAIYLLPPRLVEEFDHTDCSEVRVGDIKLPFTHVFLRFTPPVTVFLAPDAAVDGCYIANQGDEYLFSLTSRRQGLDYETSLSPTSLDAVFSIHLPAADAGVSIPSAVEQGIEQFLASNAPPEENLSATIQREDGTTAEVVDIRAKSREQRIKTFRSQEQAFRSCLNIIVNAACFIAFRPDDISEAWAGEPPDEALSAINNPSTSRSSRDRKRAALQKLEQGDYTKINICGKDLFALEQDEPQHGVGVSPRAHWRRGHWRRQRHGPSLSLVVLRWIRPTMVMKESGPMVESRVYTFPQESGNTE